MGRCYVFGCKSRAERKDEDTTFHRFPKDPALQNAWIAATGRETANIINARICSKHFEEKCFKKTKKLTFLQSGSVPTLFVQIKVTSGPSPVLRKCQVKITLGPDFNPVITGIKSEVDPVKQEEDAQSEDTLSLVEDTDQLSDADQPSEDLIPLSNAQVPLSNAPDPLSDVKVEELEVGVDEVEVTGLVEVTRPLKVTTPLELTRAVEKPTVPLPLHLRQELFRAGDDCFNLIRIQGNQINKLTIRCGKQRLKLHSYVQLIRRRNKKISNLQTEVEALRNFIGEHGWEASSVGGGKLDAPRIQIQSSNTAVVEKKPNRKLLIVKRDYNRPKSLVSVQPTSDIQTSSVGVKRTSVNRQTSVGVNPSSDILQKSLLDALNTSDKREKSSDGIPGASDVLQNSSVDVKRSLDIREKSSFGIPGTSYLQKSSVNVKSTLDIRQKLSVAVQGTSSIPKTSVVGLQRTSNINVQQSSDSVKRTSDILQNSSSGIPGTSNVLQKSSVGQCISDINIQKSPVDCQRTLGIRQKTSPGVKRISDIQNIPSIAAQPVSVIPQTSSVSFQRTSDIRQNALVIQIDGMHNTVLQPKLVRLDDNSMETG